MVQIKKSNHRINVQQKNDLGTEGENKSKNKNDKSININSPHYSETITFCDGYKAESINSAVNRRLIKLRHR